MDFVRSHLLLHPPKSDDRYAQLTRGALIINDLKAMYYTVEVHNFDLQEKTTSTLK